MTPSGEHRNLWLVESLPFFCFPGLTNKFVLCSMETLSEMFQLEIPTVHSIISKMIINEELMVSSFCVSAWLKHVINFSVNLGLFGFPDRHPLTSLLRLWSCTAQSPHPCRTWPCSLLRSWAAWWRIMSASSTLNKACMEVTSTEVCCSHSPGCDLVFK